MCRPSDEVLYVVDRVEGDKFILLGPDGTEYLAQDLPPEAREGDVVARRGERWGLCPDETRRRRQRLEEKKNRLFRKSQSGRR